MKLGLFVLIKPLHFKLESYLPSEITNLPDLEAYVKYSGYDVAKIKLGFPQLLVNHKRFVVRWC